MKARRDHLHRSRALRAGWAIALTVGLFCGGARADLQILSGACGELDTELVDSAAHLLTTSAVVTACDYVADGLSPGGLEVLNDDNLGGSSLYSEILAHELTYECEAATLLKTEGEILYIDTNGKKTDLLLEIDGVKIGVSVTRAIVFPPGTPLDPTTAENLLQDKLQDVLLSSENVRPEDAWVKQILVVETPSTADLELLVQTYAGLDPAVKADTITWMVQTDGEDEFLYFGPEPVCDVTAVASAEPRSLRPRIFPNPFNPVTTIEFELSSPATVSVDIFDLSGRHVRTLIRSQALPARSHQRQWYGRDDAGSAVASGVYVLRVRTDRQTQTRRLALIR